MEFDNSLLKFMPKLADTADEIAKRYWRAPLEVEKKQDKSPVTIADHEIEAALREMILSAYPTCGIIGEEQENIRTDAEYQWIIDPIDGTRSFIAGLATFATLIAVAKNNVPVIGLISQPITGERWLCQKGEPTQYNGQSIRIQNNISLMEATICSTSTYYFNESEAARFEQLRSQCANVSLGGDAYSYGLLANSHVELVVDAGMKIYDFAALVCVVEGAGGIITDWDGAPLTLKSDGRIIAAANTEIHRAALKILQEK